MTQKQCFEILEISPDATYEEAKAAYRLLAQVWHPDKHAHNEKIHTKATSKLKELNAAWNEVEAYFKNVASKEAETHESERRAREEKERTDRERQQRESERRSNEDRERAKQNEQEELKRAAQKKESERQAREEHENLKRTEEARQRRETERNAQQEREESQRKHAVQERQERKERLNREAVAKKEAERKSSEEISSRQYRQINRKKNIIKVLTIVGFLIVFIYLTNSTKTTKAPMPAPSFTTSVIPTETLTSESARLTELPNFVPLSGRDKQFGLTNPGWEHYIGNEYEFKVYREKGVIKVIQVIDRNGQGFSESYINSIFCQFIKTPVFVLESTEKKDGYEIQRGRIANNLEVVNFRELQWGRLCAFTITWQ